MAFVAKAVYNYAKNQVLNIVKGTIWLATHEVKIGAQGEHSGLLYLHEAGVPSRNIPPRPVLEPALGQAKVKKSMNRCMRTAMVKALTGDINGAKEEYEKAGIVGMTACKEWITDGTHLAPNAPSTIARKGSSTPLIATSVMLNSITYEIKGK